MKKSSLLFPSENENERIVDRNQSFDEFKERALTAWHRVILAPSLASNRE